MEKQIYTIEDFKRESKIRNLKIWFTEKKDKTLRFVEEHQTDILTFGPIVIPGIIAGAKIITRHAAIKKTERLKDLYCYDRSAGHYWPLRRKLSTREWIEIDTRRENGEKLKDILIDLRVL